MATKYNAVKSRRRRKKKKGKSLNEYSEAPLVSAGLLSKRRKQHPDYERETAKIRENKKKYGDKVHKFVEADWTHPNGHPRCMMCGDEKPISAECNRDATPEEEAAFNESLRAEFNVSKHGDPDVTPEPIYLLMHPNTKAFGPARRKFREKGIDIHQFDVQWNKSQVVNFANSWVSGDTEIRKAFKTYLSTGEDVPLYGYTAPPTGFLNVGRKTSLGVTASEALNFIRTHAQEGEYLRGLRIPRNSKLAEQLGTVGFHWDEPLGTATRQPELAQDFANGRFLQTGGSYDGIAVIMYVRGAGLPITAIHQNQSLKQFDEVLITGRYEVKEVIRGDEDGFICIVDQIGDLMPKGSVKKRRKMVETDPSRILELDKYQGRPNSRSIRKHGDPDITPAPIYRIMHPYGALGAPRGLFSSARRHDQKNRSGKNLGSGTTTTMRSIERARLAHEENREILSARERRQMEARALDEQRRKVTPRSKDGRKVRVIRNRKKITTREIENPFLGPMSSQGKRDAQDVVRHYTGSERKYADLVLRIADKFQQLPDRKKAAEREQKYGIKVGRQREIENTILGIAFPERITGPRKVKRSFQGQATDKTRESLIALGARSSLEYPYGKPGQEYRKIVNNVPMPGAHLAKANKGEHRGRWVRVETNGVVVPLSDEDAARDRARLLEFWQGERKIKRIRPVERREDSGQDETRALMQRRERERLAQDIDENYKVGEQNPRPKKRVHRKGVSAGKIPSADLPQRKYRGFRPGPARDFGEEEPSREQRKKKGRRIKKNMHDSLLVMAYINKHGDPDITPAPLYRVLHPHGALGAPWDHKNSTLGAGRKLTRLPRGGQHKQVNTRPEFLPKRFIEPEQAVYQRNNGSTKISNQRLAELFEDPKKMTDKEKQLILSAGGQRDFDGGKPEVKVYVVRSREHKKKSRQEIITAIRAKVAAGSGDRSDARLSLEQRKLMNKKRAVSLKNSYEGVRKQMIADFSEDGASVMCVFCKRNMPVGAVTLETPKPKEIGGKYERGNVLPAHATCNTKAGTKAQKNPEKYYADMMKEFLVYYKRQSPEIQKGLGFVFNKHRKFLGGKR